MSNFTLQQLLTYDPVTALCIRINDVLDTALNPRYVELKVMEPAETRRIRVRVIAREHLPNKEHQFFTGQCDLMIDRVDIAEVIGSTLEVPYDNAITARDVGNYLHRTAGIVFNEDDFSEQIITPTDNQLIMNPRSLRWFGRLTIVKK